MLVGRLFLDHVKAGTCLMRQIMLKVQDTSEKALSQIRQPHAETRLDGNIACAHTFTEFVVACPGSLYVSSVVSVMDVSCAVWSWGGVCV